MEIYDINIDISYNLSKYGHMLDKKFLLNTDKNNFDFIEKIVYDIANTHCIKKNKDINDFFIEFYFNSSLNTILCQNKDINDNIYLSTLTLLNTNSNSDSDSNSDIIFEFINTNINYDDYKYKLYGIYDNFLEKNFNHIKIAYLHNNNHISFNGNNINLITILDNEQQNKYELNNYKNTIFLYINILHKKPSVDCYTYTNKTNNYDKQNLCINLLDYNCKNVPPIIVNNIINENFYEKMFYKNKLYESFYFLGLLYDAKSIDRIGIIDIINKYEPNKNIDDILKEKFGNLLSDINDINNNTIKINNRFLQRFYHTNTLNINICNWIINEAEEYANKYGWSTNNFLTYKTRDIKLEKLQNVFGFFLNVEMKNIIKLIQKDYCLPENTLIDIQDINVIKYDIDNQLGLEYHTDTSFLTFNITLNDSLEYDGGGTVFDDGIIMKCNQGDMIIHSGISKHKGIDISRGKRYIIIGFLNIQINSSIDIKKLN